MLGEGCLRAGLVGGLLELGGGVGCQQSAGSKSVTGGDGGQQPHGDDSRITAAGHTAAASDGHRPQHCAHCRTWNAPTGRFYLTSYEHEAVLRRRADGEYETVIQGPLAWTTLTLHAARSVRHLPARQQVPE
ncbi:hypothetical protein ACGFIY_29950 [Micromonospora chersina]|uniref:hypothetical protein n=1 Tax=Micromonospora chersina TaxID=47854 RepID=UPI00372458EB